MSNSTVRGLFITGTDTEVGKTYVAALMARSLAAAGCRVGVYKPVATACRREEGRLVSDDALQLWEAAGRPGELDRVCPQRFTAPLAPHLAARAEAGEVSPSLLRSGLDYWLDCSDIVLVEGAGGLLSPASEDEYMADLAYDFGLPLVVVTTNSLGTIHRTLSTLVVASTFRRGLEVAGVVLNESQPPGDDDPSRESNLAELRARSVPPILATVGWKADRFTPAVDWYAVATGRRKSPADEAPSVTRYATEPTRRPSP